MAASCIGRRSTARSSAPRPASWWSVSNAVPAANATGDSSEKRSTRSRDAPQSSSALRTEYTQLTGLIIVPSSATSKPAVPARSRRDGSSNRYQCRGKWYPPQCRRRAIRKSSEPVLSVTTSTRPPGLSSRRTAASTAAGSGRCSIVWIRRAPSNEASGRSSVSTRPRCTVAPRRRAAAIARSSTSMPSVRHPGGPWPARRSRWKPSPHPTSTMRASAGRPAKACSSRRASSRRRTEYTNPNRSSVNANAW